MIKVFVIIMALLYVVLPGVSSAGSFKDNGNRTVTDSKTHLMWQQGESNLIQWEPAITYCKGLSLAGYNDWRLPNIEELKSIIDVGKIPAINKTYFPNASSGYWSSTTDASGTSCAWDVDFYGVYSDYCNKTNWFYVRCVRGGK